MARFRDERRQIVCAYCGAKFKDSGVWFEHIPCSVSKTYGREGSEQKKLVIASKQK